MQVLVSLEISFTMIKVCQQLILTVDRNNSFQRPWLCTLTICKHGALF